MSTICTFYDYKIAGNITSTPTQYSLLEPLLSSTGLLQQFAQHAKPYFQNNAYGLRQNILLVRAELTMMTVSAQSNAILSADIYNTTRVAIVQSGVDFINTNNLYLTGVLSGTDKSQTTKVFMDKISKMETQAWNQSSGYNSPGVQITRRNIKLNITLKCNSTNTSGQGANWITNGKDLILNWVSDSTITPHPTIDFNLRVYFKYL
jgi:hypothetical protein